MFLFRDWIAIDHDTPHGYAVIFYVSRDCLKRRLVFTTILGLLVLTLININLIIYKQSHAQ